VSEIVTERSGTVRLDRSRTSSLHGLQPPCGSITIAMPALGGGRINNPGRYLVLLPPITERPQPRELSTSPRIQEIRTRRGTLL
jgi:hypothetical protein